jgi:hypothetical protein
MPYTKHHRARKVSWKLAVLLLLYALAACAGWWYGSVDGLPMSLAVCHLILGAVFALVGGLAHLEEIEAWYVHIMGLIGCASISTGITMLVVSS